MIGRFSMGKQVSTPSMSKKTGKPVKAQFGAGSYPKATVARKFSKLQTPRAKKAIKKAEGGDIDSVLKSGKMKGLPSTEEANLSSWMADQRREREARLFETSGIGDLPVGRMSKVGTGLLLSALRKIAGLDDSDVLGMAVSGVEGYKSKDTGKTFKASDLSAKKAPKPSISDYSAVNQMKKFKGK